MSEQEDGGLTAAPRAQLIASVTGRVSTLGLVAELAAAFADFAGLDALAGGELCSAVLEASKNVVYHAYDGLEGPLEVELRLSDDAIEAIVRDRGMGIRPLVGERSLPHNGIGMGIIHAAADRILYTTIADGGTELRMFFGSAPDTVVAPPPGPAPSGPPRVEASPAALGSAAAEALARLLAGELDAGAAFARAAAREAAACASKVGSEAIWVTGVLEDRALVLRTGRGGRSEAAEELRLDPSAG